MLHLHLHAPPEIAAIYQQAARRIRGLDLVQADGSHDAVVITDLENACAADDPAKHMLIHPVAVTTPEALNDLATACNKNDRLFMPGHVWRFQPSVQVIKKRLAAGKLGEPGLLRIHRWDPHASIAYELFSQMDLGIWLFDRPPDHIYAVANEGYLQVHLGFPEGGMALVDICSAFHSKNSYGSLSLIGSTGAAYADDHHNANLLYHDEGAFGMVTSQGETHWTALLQEFVDAIREQRSPSVTVESALWAEKVSQAALLAAENGCVYHRTADDYECA